MRSSETTDKLYPALLAAIPAFGALHKSATNPHFRSNYLPLDGLVDAIAPALRAQGIIIMQGSDPQDDNGVTLITRLVHAPSGQWVENVVRVPMDKGTAQGAGSAITYARRYGLQALLGLVADDDDDGNAASAPRATASVTVEPALMPMGEHQGKPMRQVPDEALLSAQKWANGSKDPRAPRVKAIVENEIARRIGTEMEDIISGRHPE